RKRKRRKTNRSEAVDVDFHLPQFSRGALPCHPVGASCQRGAARVAAVAVALAPRPRGYVETETSHPSSPPARTAPRCRRAGPAAAAVLSAACYSRPYSSLHALVQEGSRGQNPGIRRLRLP